METRRSADCGSSKLQIRDSPTLLVIGETPSERSTNKQQEPKLLAFVARDKQMCDAFQNGRDIYATIAGISFNMPYEKCLEFHPETHEYQPDGKARRGEAKTIVLGRPTRLVVLA